MKRSESPALDAILGDIRPVLDHGFVRPVDYMGDDSAVVQAARVSYGDGTKTARDDAGLIRYLLRHRHTSPFEMCVIKLHIKAPIFVARQWLRHRTAAVNEISARYSVMRDEFYVPDPAVISAQAKNNKQGRAAEPLSPARAVAAAAALSDHAKQAYALYEHLLGHDEPEGLEPHGVARELARMTLPLNLYTEWYWRMDLHNLLHFLALRLDPHAQYEIRVYAEAIGEVVKAWVPVTWAAFEEYRLKGAALSAAQLAWVRAKLAGESTEGLLKQMSAGERREFFSLMEVKNDD